MPSRVPRLTRMTTPTSERSLLLAYVAVEASSLAAALNALADQNAASRAGAYQAQAMADNAAWRWCRDGDLVIEDPSDRIIAARQFLTENIEALERIKDWAPL